MTSSAGLTNHASMFQKEAESKSDFFNYPKHAWTVCACDTLQDNKMIQDLTFNDSFF